MNRTFKKLAVGSAVALLAASSLTTISPVEAKAASKPTKVTVWHAMNGNYNDAFQDEVKAFNASQKKYRVVATGQGDYTTLNQKVMAAAKSKTLPVISQATYTQVPDYAKQGIVQNLDKQVKGKDGWSKKDLKNIYPGFLEQTKYDGHYYAMPFSASVRVMLYNKTILDKYNLEVPKTWDDIQKMAPTLAADGIATVGFDKSYDMEWDGLVRSAGTQIVDKKGHVKADSKDAVQAADMLNGMLDKGYALTAGSDMYGTNNFVNGKTALSFSSSAGVSATKEAVPDGFDWGTAVIPAYQGKRATQFAGNNLVLTSQANKKEAVGAFAFMKFLASDKQTEKWAEKTGYLPITKKAANSKQYNQYLKDNPLATAGADSLQYGFSDAAFPGYQEYRNNLTATVDKMVTKHTPAKEALKTLNQQIEKTIKDNK